MDRFCKFCVYLRIMYTSTELLTRILNARLFGSSDTMFAQSAGYKGRSTITAFRRALINPSDSSDRMANTILANLAVTRNIKSISSIENIIISAEILNHYEYSGDKLREIIFSDFSDLESETRHRILNIKNNDFEAFYMGVALYMANNCKVRVSCTNFKKTAIKYSRIIDKIISGNRKNKAGNIEQRLSAERFSKNEILDRFDCTILGLISVLGQVMIQYCDSRRMIEKLQSLGEIVPKWPRISFWKNPENDSEIWNIESSAFGSDNGIYEAVRIPNELDYKKMEFVRMAFRKIQGSADYNIIMSRHPDTYRQHDDHTIAMGRAFITDSEIRFQDGEHEKLGLPMLMKLSGASLIRKRAANADLKELIIRGSCHYAGIEIDTDYIIDDVMVSRKKVIVIVRHQGREKRYTFSKADHPFLSDIRPSDRVYIGSTCREPDIKKAIWITPSIFAVEI